MSRLLFLDKCEYLKQKELSMGNAFQRWYFASGDILRVEFLLCRSRYYSSRIILVATASRNALSCSTNIIVGSNRRMRDSI